VRMSEQQAAAIKARRARQTSVLGHRPGTAPPRPKPMAKSTGKREVQQDLLAAADCAVVNISTDSGKESGPAGKPEALTATELVSSASQVVTRFDITPVPKPRQTQSDRWKKRPCVVRYREFKDQIKALGLDVPETGCRLIFVLPMPESWTKKKRAQMNGQPHQQRPDTDNMIKAVLDAVHAEDSQIYHVESLKFWGEAGAIIVEKTRQALSFDGQQIRWSA